MFEQLESRTLMSCSGWNSDGNSLSKSFSDGTFARLRDGDLTITSGAKDQNLVVTELSATSIPASSQRGTFLVQNLVTGEEFTFTKVQEVEIKTGKGNDTISFNGKSAAAEIDTGDGNDSVTVLDRGDDSSDIDTGDGNDQIAIVFSKRAKIHAGSGDDVISLQTAAAVDPTLYDFDSARLTVDAGSGKDTFVAYAGKANVSNARSNDTFQDKSANGNAFRLVDSDRCWS